MLIKDYIIGFITMTRPSRFIKNSDYKSVGNDAEATISLNIPASFTIPTWGETEFHTDIQVGKRNAPLITQMTNSRQPGFTTPAPCITVVASNSSMPSYGQLGELWTSAILYRLNPTTIRLSCSFGSQASETITCTNAAQTITAKIKTFLDPFDN